jgi:hypothetical protein
MRKKAVWYWLVTIVICCSLFVPLAWAEQVILVPVIVVFCGHADHGGAVQSPMTVPAVHWIVQPGSAMPSNSLNMEENQEPAGDGIETKMPPSFGDRPLHGGLWILLLNVLDRDPYSLDSVGLDSGSVILDRLPARGYDAAPLMRSVTGVPPIQRRTFGPVADPKVRTPHGDVYSSLQNPVQAGLYPEGRGLPPAYAAEKLWDYPLQPGVTLERMGQGIGRLPSEWGPVRAEVVITVSVRGGGPYSPTLSSGLRQSPLVRMGTETDLNAYWIGSANCWYTSTDNWESGMGKSTVERIELVYRLMEGFSETLG